MQHKTDKTVRMGKLGSSIKRYLAEILPDFTDEQSQIITVNKVEVSADFKYAKVWISVLGNDGTKVIEQLHKNIYDIQGELNKRVNLRMVPKISFLEDTSPAYAQKIEEVIRDLNKE